MKFQIIIIMLYFPHTYQSAYMGFIIHSVHIHKLVVVNFSSLVYVALLSCDVFKKPYVLLCLLKHKKHL